MNLNFSEVKPREALPEGLYVLIIEKVEEKTSSTGKPMLNVRFREQETENVLFTNFILLPENLWYLQQLLNALGMDATQDMDSDDLISELIGAEVKAKVTQRMYNEQLVNDIKSFTAV